MLSFEWSEDGLSGHLLPPRTSLFVPHDEVLVIDTRQVKVKNLAAYCRFPHQTGVTERSISRHDRSATDRVLHQVMIGHQSHRIGDGLAVVLNRQHHVTVGDKGGLASFRVGGTGERVEHPFEMILAREPRRRQQRQNH